MVRFPAVPKSFECLAKPSEVPLYRVRPGRLAQPRTNRPIQNFLEGDGQLARSLSERQNGAHG